MSECRTNDYFHCLFKGKFWFYLIFVEILTKGHANLALVTSVVEFGKHEDLAKPAHVS